MAVEGQVVDDPTVVVQGEPATETVDDSQHSLGVDLDKAQEVAKAFIAERDAENRGEVVPDSRQRDDKGRFSPREEAAPVDEAPAAPALDQAWVEAAKQEGLTEAQIGGYTSPDQVQSAIIANRLQKLNSLGISADEFAAFRQWQNQPEDGQQPQTPAAQPAPASTETKPGPLADLSIELDSELDDSVTGPQKQTIEYINKLKAAFVDEIGALRAEREQEVRQRGESAQKSQQDADHVVQFDNAVANLPGFSEHFGGKPSDMDALMKSNQNDPRVRRFQAWGMAHLGPAYDKHVRILGPTPRALELSIQEAWKESGFSKGASPVSSSTNGAATLRPGSVVPMSPASSRSDEPQSQDSFSGEYDAALSVVRDAFKEAGGNPFNTGN